MKNIFVTAAVGVAFTFAAFFASILIVGKKKEEKVQRMQRLCVVFSNNGFLGIPLAIAVFGRESLVFTVLILLNIITNVFILVILMCASNYK